MPDITAVFLRWVGMRAVLHRGYWLVTSLYLVGDANLSAFQLVFLGTAQGIVSLVCEVPVGPPQPGQLASAFARGRAEVKAASRQAAWVSRRAEFDTSASLGSAVTDGQRCNRASGAA